MMIVQKYKVPWEHEIESFSITFGINKDLLKEMMPDFFWGGWGSLESKETF